MCHHVFPKTLSSFTQNLNHHSSFNAVAIFLERLYHPWKLGFTSNFKGQEINRKVVAMVCSLIGIAVGKRKQEFTHPEVCVGPVSFRLRWSSLWCHPVSSFRLALTKTQDLYLNLQCHIDIESPTRLDAREHFLQRPRIIWTKEAPNPFELWLMKFP